MEEKYKILVNYLKDLIDYEEDKEVKLIFKKDIIRILKALEEVE